MFELNNRKPHHFRIMYKSIIKNKGKYEIRAANQV